MKFIGIAARLCFVLITVLQMEHSTYVNAGSEPSEGRNMLVYPSGRDIKPFSLHGGEVRGVAYNLTAGYPASEVLLFYEQEMAKRGFEPYTEPYYNYSDRTWQTFEDQKPGGTFCISQLLADWINQKERKRARLMLRYIRSTKCNERSIILGEEEKLQVTFQVMPHSLLPAPE
jgi:hypothetical protein